MNKLGNLGFKSLSSFFTTRKTAHSTHIYKIYVKNTNNTKCKNTQKHKREGKLVAPKIHRIRCI